MKLRLLMGMVVIVAVLLASVGAAQPAAKTEWKAGIARVVITPDQPMWMGGYAARTKPAEGKLHDLFAKALALADSKGQRVVIVTTDLLGLPGEMAEAIAQRVAQTYKLPRASLALTSSHTHTGPVLQRSLEGAYFLNEEQNALIRNYTKQTTEKIIALVGEALYNLSPAKLEFTRTAAHFAMNRRQKIQANPGQPGVKDDDVPLLRVTAPDGRLRAVLFSYACHNTTLTGEFYQYSGDYAGFAQAELEAAHPGAMAMFMMGCGADINPEPRSSLTLAQQHGKELATAVSVALQQTATPVRGRLKTAFARVPLSIVVPTREQLQTQSQEKDRFRQAHAQRWLQRLDRDGKMVTEYPYPIQVVQLGHDLTFIALAGEVVVDYVLRLKRELGGDGLWVAAYSNDVMAYIPSVRILNEGGYEAGGAMIYYDLPGPWHSAVEEKVIRKIHELVRQCGRKTQRY